MIPGSIQQRRAVSLILVLCIIYISVPLSTEHIKNISAENIEQTITACTNEISEKGITMQVFECLGVIQIFGVLDAFALLDPGTFDLQEFFNRPQKKKRRPQMARQNLNEEAEHLF